MIYRLGKRTLDIIISLFALILVSPLLLAVSLLIMLSSGLPVIYVHRRVGLNGREISVYKFRTMIQGADQLERTLSDDELEEYSKEYKLDNDPRILKLGRILRHTSLDELPQLMNILYGSMSLIGPRPVMRKELEYYTEDEQKLLLSVKPGLSGYWQVHGRGHAYYEDGRRQEMELYYAAHASLGLDIRLFFGTFGAVLHGRGAR